MLSKKWPLFIAGLVFFCSAFADSPNKQSAGLFLRKEPAEKTFWYGGLVAKMIFFYGQACSNSEADGCFNLAAIYDTVDESVKNKSTAAEHYKKACEIGHALACNNLGILYAEGEGVAIDFNAALNYFDKSCKMQEDVGCKNLAIATNYQRQN